MNYPRTIKDLIECFKKLPGIGEKTAERLALSTLEIDSEVLDLFSETLKNVKTKIKRCNKCNNLSEEDLCEICSDINISSLIERIKKEDIKEIILALKPSIEGETTSLYISKLLEKEDVKITKIAHGIPIGVDMEYIDTLTLEMALEDRKSVS